MKLFLNMLKVDFQRTLTSWKFVIAVCGYTLVTCLTMMDELIYFLPGETSIYYIFQIIRYLDFHIVYLIFAAVPGTLLFCSDWDNRYIRFSVVRSGKWSYACSKAIVCFLSAVCVVVCAELLTLALFSFQFPIFSSQMDSASLGPYACFGSNNRIVLYFIVKILYEAFTAGFLCVFALWFSTKVTNEFVALATPMLAYYLISMLSSALQIPALFHIGYLSNGYVSLYDSPVYSFLWTMGILTISAAAVGWRFVRSCIWRIEHG